MWAFILAVLAITLAVCGLVWFLWLWNNTRQKVLEFDRKRSELWDSVLAAPSVFVSYRRSDSRSVAFRLASELRTVHGFDVFIDEKSIIGGDDLWPSIQEPLRQADVVYFVIDSEWESSRLFEEKDYVRREVLLTLHNNTKTVPVLIDNRNCPAKNELIPAVLHPLFDKVGCGLDSGGQFEDNVGNLAQIASTHRGRRTLARSQRAKERDTISLRPFINSIARAITGGAIVSAFCLVLSSALGLATWQLDRAESKLNKDIEEQKERYSQQEHATKESTKTANNAYSRATNMQADVSALNNCLQFSLDEVVKAERLLGGDKVVCANWNKPRRIVVEGYAHKFEAGVLLLLPKKEFSDNPGIKLKMALPDDASDSIKATCLKIANSKSKVRVTGIVRVRIADQISGTLDIVVPLVDE